MNGKKLLVAAAVAGLLSSNVSFAEETTKEAAKPKAKATKAAKSSMGFCKEKNDCHTKGTCAGKSSDGTVHDCKGKNTCANNLLKGKTKEQCDKLGLEFVAA